MADPTLTLGAAVIKAACKIWLQDQKLASDLSVRVVDIIEDRIAGTREKRKVKRVFETLEESVADRILTALHLEFQSIEENEKTATILAVAETFDKTKLTSSDLFSFDLDPLYLERYLRSASRRATDGLSEDAIELYGRLLTSCCQYIVELSNTLPGFETGAFAAILSRQTEIVNKVDEVLARVDLQRRESRDFFESSYRQLVAKRLDHVEIFGATITENLRSYELTTAYVSLKVASPELRVRLAQQRLNEETRSPDQKENASAENTTIEESLTSTRRLYLRGEAGSGKTTLLQWLAVNSAKRSFREPLLAWNDTVPLLIRLRRYAGRNLPSPEDFLEGIGRHIADQMPSGWVHNLLEKGLALVLIDGIDELPAAERNTARDWLREILDAYPNARYIVTSRPAAVTESWLDQDDFDVLEIQPMSMADIEAFVFNWHLAFKKRYLERQEQEEITKNGQNLLEAVRSRRHLRRLATSPLLTALLCALNLDRRMQLPNDRMELYSVALDMLLERRDIERQISSNLAYITRIDKVLILEDLAYWLIRNGLSDAATDRIIARLGDKLATMRRVHIAPDEVLKLLLDRSGLLRMPTEGRVDFIHRTFQEYLAARAAIASDDIGVLVNNAHDDQWREVILMAAGQAQPRQREELISRMLERADSDAKNKHLLQALTLGCLQNSPEISPDLNKRLQRLAAKLLPPRSFTEAAALSHAGDLALELVPSELKCSQQAVAATVRMAGIIGGEAAFTVIQKCAGRKGTSIRAEVERSWPRFDAERYAQQILSKNYKLSHISLEDPALIPGLKHLEINTLTCHFTHGYGDFQFLRELPNLKWLIVREDPNLTNLSDISACPRIDSIELGRTGKIDISPLGNCTALRKVDLTYPLIEDVRALGSLPDVKTVHFSGTVETSRLASLLPSSISLERFGLWEAGHLHNLSEILSLPQIQALDFLLLAACKNLENIDGVQMFADTMTGIYIHAPKLGDLKPLARLTKIDFANLAYTPISDLSFLANAHKLQRLHIGGIGPLPDLTPLRELPKLRHLHFWSTGEVDVSALSGVKNLEITQVHKGTKVIGQDRLGKGSKVVLRRPR
jgi:Leucine-rich repeat (LRR) protein